MAKVIDGRKRGRNARPRSKLREPYATEEAVAKVIERAEKSSRKKRGKTDGVKIRDKNGG